MQEKASERPWSRSAEPTTLVGIALALIQGMEEQGLERARILESARLKESLLADPDGRVPAIYVWRLWRLAIETMGDPDLGIHMAERFHVRNTGLLGYAILHSRTVGQALARLVRYSRIVSETVGYKLQRSLSAARLTLDPEPRFDALRHPVDARLGGVLSVLREITGRPIKPLAVHLTYQRPEKTLALRQHYQAPLTFGARTGMLELRASDLELPLTAADERLARYLDQLAEQKLRALSQGGSVADRIMRALWSALADGVPALAQIATGIGMSARTLQRRLREEGTSYAAIIDQVRREMAPALLQDRGLAVYEVGYLLGYSDAAAFHRAFRRWTSRSPRQFRRKQVRKA